MRVKVWRCAAADLLHDQLVVALAQEEVEEDEALVRVVRARLVLEPLPHDRHDAREVARERTARNLLHEHLGGEGGVIARGLAHELLDLSVAVRLVLDIAHGALKLL